MFLAYGSTDSYIIYLPVLAAGMIMGLSWSPLGRLKWALVGLFVGLGVTSSITQYRTTVKLWRETKRSEKTAGLYAKPAWAEEWSQITELGRDRKLLVLSYGSGSHHFFPQVQSPDNWFLLPGLIFESERQRLLAKLGSADVIVQDLGSPTQYVDQDRDIQQALRSICMTNVTSNFRIWRRPQANLQGLDCKDPSPK